MNGFFVMINRNYFILEENMRIRFSFIIMIITSLLTGCNIRIETGSGNVITESRAVSNFNQIYLLGIGELIIKQGDKESFQIEAEDNVITLVETEVKNQILNIRFDNKNWQDNVVPTKPIKLFLTVKDLSLINLSGTGSISAGSLQATNLEIISSGAGSIEIRNLAANRLTLNISGVGGCDLNGKVSEQSIYISGTGIYNAEDLESQKASITITGAGNAIIWAKESLEVVISGAGNVDYYDEPQITQSISGVGNIRSLGTH
jgi:hypothetical protein